MINSNLVKLIGNLGADPKIIETEKSKFAVLSLATAESYKDKENEWQNKETIWHEVITFKPALIEKMKDFKKGAAVEIKGSISYRPFETTDEHGKKITKKEASIIANSIELALTREKS